MPCSLLNGSTAQAHDLASRLRGYPGMFWLDSNSAFHTDGRWSYLGACPVDVRRISDAETSPFEMFDHNPTDQDALEPLIWAPRWVVCLAYPASVHGSPGLPFSIWAARYKAVIALDHWRDQVWVVGDDLEAVEQMQQMLQSPVPQPSDDFALGEITSSSRADFIDAVHVAQSWITRGDVYEVNVARRWSAMCEGDPWWLWQTWRDASPVPLGAWIDTGDVRILSRSMERFLWWDPLSRTLLTRPIKGTLVRQGMHTDPLAMEQLVRDPKEHAEHAMVVDLMRNDLGQLAEPGSVGCPMLMQQEPYAGLWHLVSTISCTTRQNLSIANIIDATFPPGSVTGCPKRKAMSLIDKVEPKPGRGMFTGAMGYVSRHGGLSLSVAIRTAVHVDSGSLQYWAGSGIVSASDALKEADETELKADLFLKTLLGMDKITGSLHT